MCSYLLFFKTQWLGSLKIRREDFLLESKDVWELAILLKIAGIYLMQKGEEILTVCNTPVKAKGALKNLKCETIFSLLTTKFHMFVISSVDYCSTWQKIITTEKTLNEKMCPNLCLVS